MNMYGASASFHCCRSAPTPCLNYHIHHSWYIHVFSCASTSLRHSVENPKGQNMLLQGSESSVCILKHASASQTERRRCTDCCRLLTPSHDYAEHMAPLVKGLAMLQCCTPALQQDRRADYNTAFSMVLTTWRERHLADPAWCASLERLRHTS